ncbi:MAG TPA: Scr1 family TA system antitoxin-like transcriptional regulator [Candidatus Saccharimonadales bacterium]|nr:Scr1 family TA system antitoxin-like transcriptional regulator [Candidatus Saccharimonadales bacterium]
MGNTFDIGQVIRDLRRQHNLTGGQLAKKSGLSQSKISRIETGNGPNLKRDEIVKILNILDAPQTILQQAAGVLDQPITVDLRRIQPNYLFEQSYQELRRTNRYRVFSISLIPALLQIAQYRQVVIDQYKLADEQLRVAMRTTTERQDMLWDQRKKFHFIIHETVLYNIVDSYTTQIAQLDRLDRLINSRNINIGILATVAGMVPLDINTFALFDDRRVSIVTVGADIMSREPEHIAKFSKLFAELGKRADYNDNARSLIQKAIDYFSYTPPT